MTLCFIERWREDLGAGGLYNFKNREWLFLASQQNLESMWNITDFDDTSFMASRPKFLPHPPSPSFCSVLPFEEMWSFKKFALIVPFRWVIARLSLHYVLKRDCETIQDALSNTTAKFLRDWGHSVKASQRKQMDQDYFTVNPISHKL